MPPRPRRSSTRVSTARKSEAVPAEEHLPQEVEVDASALEAGGAVASAEAASAEAAPVEESSRASQRRGASARRSQRRGAGGGGSERGAAVSSRRTLTPEQIAARRAATRTVLVIVLCVVCGLGVVAGGFFLLRTPERMQTANRVLDEARREVHNTEIALDHRDPVTARAHWQTALTALEKCQQLGYAQKDVNPEDPQLASLEKAHAAYELKVQLTDLIKPRIERAERDRTAQMNLERLLDGFGRLQAMPDAELVTFRKSAEDFQGNPVDPVAGRSEVYVKDYDGLITDVRTRMLKIEQEEARRREAITDAPVRTAKQEATTLVLQERFKDALAKIDDLQRQFANADFGRVRGYVTDAAKQAWESAAKYSEEMYKTYRAPGTPEDHRGEALQNAQRRMQEVIDRFGIDEYVDQAKQALAKYQKPAGT